MLIQDYRIIKQIRDQFHTSNYLLDSITTLTNFKKLSIPEDSFIEEIPLPYLIEQQLINLNKSTFKSYSSIIQKISEKIKELIPNEKKEEVVEFMQQEEEKHQKKRRKLMRLNFNISKKTNSEVCEEILRYFETIMPKTLLEDKLNKELNLKSDFSTLLTESKNSSYKYEIKETGEKSCQAKSKKN